MFKSSILITMALVLALASAPSSAGRLDAQQRDACISDAAAYLATGLIDASLAPLVAASRSIYPDVLELIENDVPVGAYERALRALGPPAACKQLEEHVAQVSDLVPCFNELSDDENGLLDIARADEGAMRAIEAHMACAFAG